MTPLTWKLRPSWTRPCHEPGPGTGSHFPPASIPTTMPTTTPCCPSPLLLPSLPFLCVRLRISVPWSPLSLLCKQHPKRPNEKVKCDSPQQEMRYQSVRDDSREQAGGRGSQIHHPASGQRRGRARRPGQKLEQRGVQQVLCEYRLKDKALTGHLETDRQTDRGQEAQSPGPRLRLCSDRCSHT